MSRRRAVQVYQPPQLTPQQQLALILQQLAEQQVQTYRPPLPPQHYRPDPPRRKKKRESGGQVIKNGFIGFLLSWIPCGMGFPGATFIVWIMIAAYWMEHILRGKRR